MQNEVYRPTFEERTEHPDRRLSTTQGVVTKSTTRSDLAEGRCSWPWLDDARIAEAFSCRVQTVESLRKRLVTDGFEIALNGKPRENPPRQKSLDGKQEAKVIAMRLGKPPKGFSNWSLRLMADRVVELGLVDWMSHETIRQTLKKTE